MPDTPAPLSAEPPAVGSLSAAISNAVVGLLHTYTGRGPTHARTTIGPDTIVVTLRDSLTKAERVAVEIFLMSPAGANGKHPDGPSHWPQTGFGQRWR